MHKLKHKNRTANLGFWGNLIGGGMTAYGKVNSPAPVYKG